MKKNINKKNNIIISITKLIFYIFKSAINIFKMLYKKLIKRLRFSITFKITSMYAMKFMFFLMFLSFGIISIFVIYAEKDVESNLNKNVSLTESYLDVSGIIPKNSIDKLALLENQDISIFTDNGNILYSSNGIDKPVNYSKIKSNIISKINSDLYIIKSSNYNNNLKISLVLQNKITWNNSDVYIQITDRLTKEYQSLGLLIFILLILDVLFILITVFSGAASSRKMLAPIETMTKTVKNITVNAFDTRLNVSGSQDELKELAETFNNMLDRIQQSYKQQDQFVSDASHELRTPISVIQGYINLLDRWGKNDEAVLQESIEAIKSESENMKELVEKLLFLARGDKNTQKVEKNDFYLNELIDEIVKETKLIDTHHEVLIIKNQIVLINADLKLIKQALRAFIDNSIKYTEQGGKIFISSFTEKQRIIITIEDTGIGIEKDDLPHIFDRFYRADKSRTKQTGGTGLGLAIAKWIIFKHSGNIEVQSKIDEGTRITLSLPAYHN